MSSDAAFPRGRAPRAVAPPVDEAAPETGPMSIFDTYNPSTRPDKPTKSAKKREKAKKKTVAAAGAAAVKDIKNTSINILSKSSLKAGMTMLAVVKEVKEQYATLELPHNLLGRVELMDVSATFTKQIEKELASDSDEDEDEAMDGSEKPASDLSEVLRVGQVVPACILGVDGKMVSVSISPELLSKNTQNLAMRKGQLAYGEVVSVEDHGFGVEFHRHHADSNGAYKGILLTKNAPAGLRIGSPILTVVLSASGNAVSVSATKEHLSESVPLGGAPSIHELLPGSLVNCKMVEAVDRGCIVKVLGVFTGTLDRRHSNTETQAYEVGTKFTARVLYTNPVRRNLALSVLPWVKELSPVARPITMSRGVIVENCTVAGFTPAGVIFAVPDILAEGGTKVRRGIAHPGALSDKQLHSVLAVDFPPGMKCSARVMDFIYLENAVSLSLKASVLEAPFLQSSDVPIGASIRGTVEEIRTTSIRVKLSPNVFGIISSLHMSNTSIKNPHLKFKVGRSIPVRVLDNQDGTIALTFKKNLVKSDLPAVHSIEQVSAGDVLQGFVTKLSARGLLVSFFGTLNVWISRMYCNVDAEEGSLDSIFSIGQPIKVKVLGVDHSSDRMFASLDLNAAAAKKKKKNVKTASTGTSTGTSSGLTELAASLVEDNKAATESLVVGATVTVKCVATANGFFVAQTSEGAVVTLVTAHLGDSQSECEATAARFAGHLEVSDNETDAGFSLKAVVTSTASEGSAGRVSAKPVIVAAAAAGQFPTEIASVSFGATFPGFVTGASKDKVWVQVGSFSVFAMKAPQDTATYSKDSTVFVKVQKTASRGTDFRGRVSGNVWPASAFGASLAHSASISSSKVPASSWAAVTPGSVVGVRVAADDNTTGIIKAAPGLTAIFVGAHFPKAGGKTIARVVDVDATTAVVSVALAPGVKAKAKAPVLKASKSSVPAKVVLTTSTYVVAETSSGAMVTVANARGNEGVVSSGYPLGETVQVTVSGTAQGVVPTRNLGEAAGKTSAKFVDPALHFVEDLVVGALLKVKVGATKKGVLSLEVSDKVAGEVHSSMAISPSEVKVPCPTNAGQLSAPFRAWKQGAELTAVVVKAPKKNVVQLGLRSDLVSIKDQKKRVAAISKVFSPSAGDIVSFSPTSVTKSNIKGSIGPGTNASIFVIHAKGYLGSKKCDGSAFKARAGSVIPVRVLSGSGRSFQVSQQLEGSSEVSEGSIQGVVTKVIPSVGLIVQTSGKDCVMVPLTEMANAFKSNPLEKFPLGTRVAAHSIAGARGDVPLASLRPTPKEGSTIRDPSVRSFTEVETGSLVSGFVVNAAPGKGVFVMLGMSEEGDIITGRVLMKELAEHFVRDPVTDFPVGTAVHARVLAVNAESKRIDLSLKASAVSGVPQLQAAEVKVGSKYPAVISNVKDFGAFLILGNSSVSGLCHHSNMDLGKKGKRGAAKPASLYSPGDSVLAVCTEVGDRFSFSLKRADLVASATEGGMDVEIESESEEDADDESSDSEDDDEVEMDGSGSESDDLAAIVAQARRGAVKADEADDSESSDDEDELSSDGTASEASSEEESSDDGSESSEVSESSEEESDFEDEVGAAPSSKRIPGASRADRAAAVDAAEAASIKAADDGAAPETADDHERAVVVSPNSSYAWIRFAAFWLQGSNVGKARDVLERSLEEVSASEQTEVLNLWIAYLNLEAQFGSQDNFDEVYKRAASRTNALKLALKTLDLLEGLGRKEALDAHIALMLKKFKAYPKAWVSIAKVYLKSRRGREAAPLLKRSFLSLKPRHHEAVVCDFSRLEFKHGSSERGRTMMESLLADKNKKRMDLWSQLLDMEEGEVRRQKTNKKSSKSGIKAAIRRTKEQYDRVATMGLKLHRAKALFKRYMAFADEVDSDELRAHVQNSAQEFVSSVMEGQDDEESE